MLTQIHPPPTERETMIDTLIQYRQGWEEVAEDERLVDIQGSVGLILSDIVELLELSEQEQMTVLGAELYLDVQDVLSQQVHLID
jgi:hypothetical protein